jgi:oligogalacturonide lyase
MLVRMVLVIAAFVSGMQSEPPRDWIDPATGAHVIRLSDAPGSGSFYFHQNGYTADGGTLVFSTRDGLSAVDLKTHRITAVVEGRVDHVVVGKKTRQVFYMKGDVVYVTHLDTHVTRAIVTRAELRSGSGFAVNADETLLAGSYVKGGQPPPSAPAPAPPVTSAANGAAAKPTTPAATTSGVATVTSGNTAPPPAAPPSQESSLERRWAERLPMALYTIEIATGTVKSFHDSTDWLNHVQFSPTDPGLLMFCHEGPWHKVDRIWTIRTDGSGLRKMHTRTMDMEIAGHEFFSQDGTTVWYDLQTPKSKEFWLAGVVLATNQAIRYRVAREHWSVHYNVSPDGTRFAGDGGGPASVAAPGNGQWIYLFTPKDGVLQARKLVNLEKHDYHLEPNVTFTPDGKWIVFRSNMFGPSQVYAVEVPAT